MTKKFSITALAVSSLLAMGSAQANTITDLGPASPGTPLSFGALAQGSFNDIFTFSLPANGGSGYSITNFTLLPGAFNTILTTMSLFSNPDGVPFTADDMLLGSSMMPGSGSLALAVPSSPAGFYFLNVTGITNGQAGGIYNGAISVAIPEPETYALMLGGLGLIGFMAARRRRQG